MKPYKTTCLKGGTSGLEGRVFLKILAIESSNQTMSVATMEDGLVVAEYTRNGNLQHSTQLMPAIEYVLKSSDWEPKDLDKVAVSKGPGSYTGVRIGVTIAKTLAWTLNKPLIAVSSLKVLAANSMFFEGLIIPLMDARRGNLYTAGYKVINGILEEVLAETHVASTEWFDRIDQETHSILFIGQDIPKYEEQIREHFGNRAQFAHKNEWLPRAGILASLAKDELKEDVHTFIPEYLKKPEAEENWQKTHQEPRKGEYVERID